MAKKQVSKTLRGLVMGHLERISSNVFVKHKDVITGMVGGTNGIYALYRNKQLYYVGLAIDLKKRVNHHLKDRHQGRWTHFSLYLVRSEKHMKDLESLCLRIADPRGNKVRGKLAGAKDLRPSLKKKLRQKVIEEVDKIMGRDGAPAKKKPKQTSKAKKTPRGHIASKACPAKSKGLVVSGAKSKYHKKGNGGGTRTTDTGPGVGRKR